MATAQGGSSSRRSVTLTRKKSTAENSGGEGGGGGGVGIPTLYHRKSISAPRTVGLTGERTVKRLRLSKALTIPETTTIIEACRRMAARRVDALLLTDSNALLCGILTDKDIAMRVIALDVNIEETPVSKVMTRNPSFVLSDSLAVEALQKMVIGKFRHLPVVEKGEVIALLDIAKCLYDAIARLERAAEKGKAIAAAVEGVEKHWGTTASGPNTFVETLRERMFTPSLSTIISENSKFVTVDPSDTVLVAAKKMLEVQAGSAIVIVENKPRGILTSKDMLMRVIAQDLPPGSTLVEKVMTPNPECTTVDTPIVDALHTMHDGKFLHLPVVDKEGVAVAVVDVLHITHAAIATAGSTAGVNGEAASHVLQRFWDSALEMTPDDEDDTRSENSLKMPSEGGETGRSITYHSPTSSMFAFKIQDGKGRMHRFLSGTQSLADLIAAILQRVGDEIDANNLPQILVECAALDSAGLFCFLYFEFLCFWVASILKYEDEDKDKVVLASDNDLQAAIDHARLGNWKGLRLHLDYSKAARPRKGSNSKGMEYAQADAWASAYNTVAAGAALVAGLGVLAFLRRSGN